MGANISRHSKSISGRRSHSSASIYNELSHEETLIDPSGSPSACFHNREPPNSPIYRNESHILMDENRKVIPLDESVPVHWKFSDPHTVQCLDQGYDSERSPEEDYPPDLTEHDQDHFFYSMEAGCPFITPESTFFVRLEKGSRGLGLSVTGGTECGGSWPGLIRIKRLFPHQPASSCSLLSVGDLLLEVNGVPLTGLTNYEALEVLRTAANQVELKVCRPPPDVLNCVSPISEVPPIPPIRSELLHHSFCYSTPEDEQYHGEFEVTLYKIQGSLGFTLRKEDNSGLGHYVRALVREPALTDGRIRVGDKIMAVNGVEIFSMSHEEAVKYLRHCGDKVKIRLYRNLATNHIGVMEDSLRCSEKENKRQEEVCEMVNNISVRNSFSSNKSREMPNSSSVQIDNEGGFTDQGDYHYTFDDDFHEGLFKCDKGLFASNNVDMHRPARPSSLELNPNQTPVAARKHSFSYSLPQNSYELTNLNTDVRDDSKPPKFVDVTTEAICPKNLLKDSAGDAQISKDSFRRTTSYQRTECNESDWLFTLDDIHHVHQIQERTEGKIPNNPECLGTRNLEAKIINNLMEEFEIHTIELIRGWNSRLGFSLQGSAGLTYVSAVYPNSVAAKDGRIKYGDCILKVNDEEVEHMTTNEIINLLRIIRGPVCIFVKRNIINHIIK